MATDRTIVVETNYKNYTFTLEDDNLYIGVVDEIEGSDFQDAVITGAVGKSYDLEPAGTIAVPVYRVRKKVTT